MQAAIPEKVLEEAAESSPPPPESLSLALVPWPPGAAMFSLPCSPSERYRLRETPWCYMGNGQTGLLLPAMRIDPETSQGATPDYTVSVHNRHYWSTQGWRSILSSSYCL